MSGSNPKAPRHPTTDKPKHPFDPTRLLQQPAGSQYYPSHPCGASYRDDDPNRRSQQPAASHHHHSHQYDPYSRKVDHGRASQQFIGSYKDYIPGGRGYEDMLEDMRRKTALGHSPRGETSVNDWLKEWGRDWKNKGSEPDTKSDGKSKM